MALLERLNVLEKEVASKTADLDKAVTSLTEAMNRETLKKVEELRVLIQELNDIAEAIHKVKDLTGGH